jgi:hypothetical protein
LFLFQDGSDSVLRLNKVEKSDRNFFGNIVRKGWLTTLGKIEASVKAGESGNRRLSLTSAIQDRS